MYSGAIDNWYALFVMTGEEDKVKERLIYRFGESNLRILVPKRRMRERYKGNWEIKLRTLFPGYVLLNGSVNIEVYNKFRGVPGLIRPLKDSTGLTEIPRNEITVLSRLICDNEIIGSSNVYVEGGRIVVIDGPLLGMEGFIESIDRRKGRVKVRLNFIGEARLVELSVSMVQSA